MPHWQARLCFFSTADKPLLLSDANTRLLYRCLLSKHIHHPPCQEKWEASYGPITDKQWLSLRNFPQNMTLLQWDIAWKFLHRVLPTNTVLYTDKLATTRQCPACHKPDDTIEHAFNTCPIWKGLLRKACLLLSSLSLNPPTALHPLELINKTGNLRTLFIILMTAYWTKRKTVPPVGIMNSFKWHLRRHIQTVWCVRKLDVSFKSFWKPFGRSIDRSLKLHDLL